MNNEGNLLNQSINYVQSHKGSLPALSTETGIDYNWLRKFTLEKINNPGIIKIEALAKHAKEHGKPFTSKFIS